jgi:hypothetical protein
MTFASLGWTVLSAALTADCLELERTFFEAAPETLLLPSQTMAANAFFSSGSVDCDALTPAWGTGFK